MEDWLSDEIRRRSSSFWARKKSWPIESQGFVLLANAMLRVGSVMFGEEWHGDEPHRFALPIFDRIRPVHAQGFYAV
jgi:hypothetical protein